MWRPWRAPAPVTADPEIERRLTRAADRLDDLTEQLAEVVTDFREGRLGDQQQ